MLKLSTILCPVDLAEPSLTSFRLACALARDYGAKIIVLHVYPPPANGAEAVDRSHDPNFEKGIVTTLRENIPEHIGAVVEFRVVVGSPVEVIVNTARNCDLVVMGTHGHTGVRRALLGSVAEEVLRKSPCPVMTVRPAVHIPEQPAGTASPTKANNIAELGGGD